MSQEIGALLEAEVIQAGVAPQAVAGFARLTDQAGWQVGCAGGAGVDAVFDLASITKTCVALTVGLCVEAGELRWDTPLEHVLPWLAGTPGGEGTLEEHLSHRAGLVAHREYFVEQQAGLPVERRALLLAAARAARRTPRTEAVYSDLGYLLVGEALEARFQMPLDGLVRRRLVEPRGWELASARQWRASGALTRVVPTEIVPRRGGSVCGLVHDDNAWALGGGALCGHAGLFGTIQGVLDLASGLLHAAAGQGDLARAARALLRRRPGGSLRLGLDGISGPVPSAGALAGPNGFGHLGFTGTSFWCDPDAGVAVALLTNRVRPSRENLAIRRARPRVHDGLWSLAQSDFRSPSA